MSESAWARCIACGEMCGHAETSVVDAELERLRAENLLLAMANTDREQLKAENAELRNSCDLDNFLELKWFRRREPLVRALFDDPDNNTIIAFGEWEKANPNPGAGT